VIVVDDGGGSDLSRLLAHHRDRLDLTVLETEHAGQSHARNAGAERARGDLLAFTDDDCRPDPSWLRVLAEAHAAAPRDGFGGHTVNGLTDNWYSATSQFVLDVGYRKLNRGAAGARFFTTNNLVVPREGFLALGGLDTHFRTSEDREFCERWVASGRRLTYVPKAVVWHYHELGFASFCRQHFAYGRGAFRFHQRRSERSGRRSEIEPSFHLGLVLLEPWRSASGFAALRKALLLQVWNLANTAGFIWELARSRNGAKTTSFGEGRSAEAGPGTRPTTLER
jgi:GT2 family glycosyltransferase